jgi:ABC-type multidrug transport system ATPase subunit
VSSNTGTLPRRSYALDKPSLTLGRAASNDLVLADPTISAQHLQIVREGQQVVLLHPQPTSERTTNGLLYQGRKIRGDESYRKVLADGDVFRIGGESGTLITLTYRDGSASAQEVAPAVQPIKLEADELTLGRKPENTVVLAHALVSARHARLVREGGTYRIHDLHSTNHVYVNGQLVTSHLLKLGDEIRIGPYRLIYESTQITQYDESAAIRIDAVNLKKYGNKRTLLLNNVSVSIPPRAFVALVGGSGAGKTTLLDALSGLRPAEEGQVLYNGQDYYRNLAAFTTQIGYVPQEDIVHRDLSVERALYYAAKLRLPGDFTEEQIWQRVSEVLEDVELTERRTLLIKRLSGGQRKRVSIALELLANPSLFFLDEPTSGLDPGLDRKMMVLLRKLADKGHTIILVTHATNNINVCDYVCFLAEGGRLAYFGPPDGAKAYFEKSEFAEIYSALDATEESPNVPEEAEARFKLSTEYARYIAQPLKGAASSAPAGSTSGSSSSAERASANGKAATTPTAPPQIRRAKRGGFWQQFALLSRRRLELLRNDLPTLLILVLQAPLLGLLLMTLIRFGLGADLLEGNSIVRCQPQLRTPSGQVLVIPSAPTSGNTITCDLVQSYLQSDPAGVQYAASRGVVPQALQDFEVAGHSGDSQRLVFMLGLIPMIFGCIVGSREIIKEVAIYRRERAVNLRILPYMLSKALVLCVLALLQMASLVLIVNWFVPLGQGVFLPVLL